MRVVALSDLHGNLPVIPPCDLLIVGGDVCPDRIGSFHGMVAPEQQARWFDEHARPWLAAAPARHRVLVWGNHDWCGEHCDFSGDGPATAETSRLVILNDELVRVLVGEAAVPNLQIPQSPNLQISQSPNPPMREVTVWGSPWSSWCGEWAFMASPAALAGTYAQIPSGTDIIVSHSPAYGYGDEIVVSGGRREHLGSHELLSAIERVRPKLVVCGHIHEGHGRYDHDGIPIVNVSVVDERYRMVHATTVIDL